MRYRKFDHHSAMAISTAETMPTMKLATASLKVTQTCSARLFSRAIVKKISTTAEGLLVSIGLTHCILGAISHTARKRMIASACMRRTRRACRRSPSR